MPKTYLIFDYETFSECNLEEAGAYEYAAHPSTEIMCIGWVAGTREQLAEGLPPDLLLPTGSGPLGRNKEVARDTQFMRLLTDPDVTKVAHNAFFEQCITKMVLPRYRNLLRSHQARDLPPDHWLCTASLARAMGLPGSLDGVASALGLEHQKDLAGHQLMLKYAKPRKPTKHDKSTRHDDDDDLLAIFDYCLKDVEAERELFLRLPPLHKWERRVWKMNQRMNLRGFHVDRELVAGALHCIDREKARLDGQFRKLTGLDSGRQRDATLKWLHQRGLGPFLPNLRAGSVDEALLHPDIDRRARRVLEIRQSISKSSTSKYEKFQARSMSDGRARDNTIYYGAHTGRDAGTGLQPHNLFKSTLKHDDVMTGIDLIKAHDVTAIRALFPKPMQLYASALRSCIVAPKGHILDVGDFATIEVRVLFWLAQHEAGLQAFRDGRELYLEMASDIYESDLEALTADYFAGDAGAKQARQLGKQTVLGAGFGIGISGEKFQLTAKSYGLDISRSLAQKAIQAYRTKHAPVVKFWEVIEHAATRALENPAKAYRHGFLTWRKEGDWLTCQLPSGRKLHYFGPQMQRVSTIYGERLALTYRGVAPVSRKFIRVSTWGGKLTENVVQAVARDLLMASLVRLEKAGYPPVLAVHDEIVSERPVGFGSTKAFEALMATTPDWAPDLPVKVEAWSEARYRK